MSDRPEPGAGPDAGPDADLVVGADDDATAGIDEVLGRGVALVTLPPTTGPELDLRADRVRRLAGLHHPHLLEVFDVDGLVADAESTVVLESVEGEQLDHVLARGPLDARRTAEIGARTASALAHAHAHGVVHGRLGAASIVVGDLDDPRLVWLVGLTAVLRGPDAAHAGPADGPADGPAGDLRALAATLRAAVDPTDAAGRDALDRLLAPVDDGEITADTLSDRLFRFARDGVVDDAVPGAARTAAGPLTALTVSVPALAGAAGATSTGGPAVHSRGRGGLAAISPVLGPRAGRRVAVLGSAAASLALASGLVLWAQENTTVLETPRAGVSSEAPSAVSPPPLPAGVPDTSAGNGDGADTDDGDDTADAPTGTADAPDRTVAPDDRTRAARPAPPTGRGSTTTERPTRTPDPSTTTSEAPPPGLPLPDLPDLPLPTGSTATTTTPDPTTTRTATTDATTTDPTTTTAEPDPEGRALRR